MESKAYSKTLDKPWMSPEFISNEGSDYAFVHKEKPYPNVYIDGTVEYEPKVDYIRISIEKICNNYDNSTTWPLRVVLANSSEDLSTSKSFSYH